MLEAAHVGKNDVVYDLGSGDGRILIEAAKKYQCKAIGVEIDPDLVTLSRKRVEEAKLEKLVTIKHDDLFAADFGDATVVTVYLFPDLLKRLMPKFEKLKPGTRIVSHQFPIPDFPPEKTITVESVETGAKHTVYLWTMPLRK
jgi:cyclopropane fatty-acyl-phospholipid synthase-like methyltransferase